MSLPFHFYALPFHKLSLQELYSLMQLRQEVFVVEQDCPYIDADGKDPEATHILGFAEGGRLIACSRLLPPGVSYPGYASIGRVASSPTVRGMGAGKALMQHSIEWCGQLFPRAPIKISAQCYLTRFYEGFGFEQEGQEYLEDGIPHIGMVKS